MKKLIIIPLVAVVLGFLGTAAGCTDADIASANLSRSANMFELERRIVFYNGITDSYILTIEGRCSVETVSGQLAVTCTVSIAKTLRFRRLISKK